VLNKLFSQQQQDVIVTLFGVRQLQLLHPIEWKITQIDEVATEPILFQGFLSKPGEGRTTSDRQYLAVNRRPCDIPKVNPLPLLKINHKANPKMYPFHSYSN
jgi:DNA mismatch repair ATPase MutL